MPSVQLDDKHMHSPEEVKNSISSARLKNGEVTALGCLEIKSIPHYRSFEPSDATPEDVIEKCVRDNKDCLTKAHRLFESSLQKDTGCQDISIELLFAPTAVSGQPFRAAIRIFLIARGISYDSKAATEAVEELLLYWRTTLSSQGYAAEPTAWDYLKQAVVGIDDSNVRMIVREEYVSNLQNPILPECYTYDLLETSNEELGGIALALSDQPSCALSIQLIPAHLTIDEASAIDSLTQSLSMLDKGIHDQDAGSVSFALAGSVLKTYGYYAKQKNMPLFLGNVTVYGNETGCNVIADRMLGRLSAGAGHSSGWVAFSLNPKNVALHSNFFPLPWALSEMVMKHNKRLAFLQNSSIPTSLHRLALIFSNDEAAELFRIPIGSNSVSAGFIINEYGRATRTYADNVIDSSDIVVGKLSSSSSVHTVGFSVDDLAKHMLIVGTPGSGKTTFSVSLLDRLWKRHGVPFLVIEPAKNEYRALIKRIPELQVFTPGKSLVSPFVFNPFLPPSGVKLEVYKSTLKTAFAAGVSMTTPLDRIFEEAIDNCYSNFHWLDTYTLSDSGQIFNISDFIKCFQDTFSRIGYTGDAANIGRAGLVRLNRLVRLFDNYHSIPIEDLLNQPTVIELSAIENAEDKALIIALLLLSIFAFVNANYTGLGGLRNVILLEEAHVLFESPTTEGQGDSNSGLVAQNLLKRMLAEFRSYGVGLVVADQSPKKVTSDIVALTDLKLAFRLVESLDKQIIGNSTGMTNQQLARLGKLKPGEAFFFFGRLEEPEEVFTPNYRDDNSIDITIDDDTLCELSHYWDNRQGNLRPYPECLLCNFCNESCDYNRRVFARDVARRLFIKYFKTTDTRFDPLAKFLENITRNIIAELGEVILSPELKQCIKVHFWRNVRYGTRIPITDEQVRNSLKK